MTLQAEGTARQDPNPFQGISPETYKYLQDYVYRESGIVLEDDKHYLLQARLMPILKKEQLKTIDEICARLKAGQGDLRLRVVEAMTTNETLFFRDPAHYDALKTQIIPALMKARESTRRLCFWSAAASSGQESYSLAILLLEMGLLAQGWSIQIIGTDLSSQVLERARQGRYMQIEVNRGLPAAHLVRYFSKQGLEWQLKDNVRSMVTFERFDLRQNPSPLGMFDVIMCRNVLIYFDVPTKKKILAALRTVLRNDGCLLLGGAEAILDLDGNYARQVVGQASVYRKAVS
ncbi:MAG TPA: protein-glutamate O-methyltransferase CheR [Vicinamibacterales bacterium]|jgi:chemotaxis protein methyltransferase CheR